MFLSPKKVVCKYRISDVYVIIFFLNLFAFPNVFTNNGAPLGELRLTLDGWEMLIPTLPTKSGVRVQASAILLCTSKILVLNCLEGRLTTKSRFFSMHGESNWISNNVHTFHFTLDADVPCSVASEQSELAAAAVLQLRTRLHIWVSQRRLEAGAHSRQHDLSHGLGRRDATVRDQLGQTRHIQISSSIHAVVRVARQAAAGRRQTRTRMVHGQVMRAHARPAGEDSRAWYYSPIL
jgi:hypothetical protein